MAAALDAALQRLVRRASLRQTAKGVLTAGVGTSLSLKLLLTHGTPIASAVSAQCRLAYVFLYFSLLSHLVVFPCGGFSAQRPYALYLWALYAIFLLLSCLAETGHVDLGFLCPSGLPCPVAVEE